MRGKSVTFRDDYPPPSYAGYVWWAQRKIYLAKPGKGTQSFEDTPSGLAALRIALLGFADNQADVTVGIKPSVELHANGQSKIDDLWGED